jgi:hypothetical protein
MQFHLQLATALKLVRDEGAAFDARLSGLPSSTDCATECNRLASTFSWLFLSRMVKTQNKYVLCLVIQRQQQARTRQKIPEANQGDLETHVLPSRYHQSAQDPMVCRMEDTK